MNGIDRNTSSDVILSIRFFLSEQNRECLSLLRESLTDSAPRPNRKPVLGQGVSGGKPGMSRTVENVSSLLQGGILVGI